MHPDHPLLIVLAAALTLAGGWCLQGAARNAEPAVSPAGDPRLGPKRRTAAGLATAVLIAALALTVSPLATPSASASVCLGNTASTGGTGVKLLGNCNPSVPKSLNLSPTPALKPAPKTFDDTKLNLHGVTGSGKLAPLPQKAGAVKRDQTSNAKCSDLASCFKPQITVKPKDTTVTKDLKPYIPPAKPKDTTVTNTNKCLSNPAGCDKPQITVKPKDARTDKCESGLMVSGCPAAPQDCQLTAEQQQEQARQAANDLQATEELFQQLLLKNLLDQAGQKAAGALSLDKQHLTAQGIADFIKNAAIDPGDAAMAAAQAAQQLDEHHGGQGTWSTCAEGQDPGFQGSKGYHASRSSSDPKSAGASDNAKPKDEYDRIGAQYGLSADEIDQLRESNIDPKVLRNLLRTDAKTITVLIEKVGAENLADKVTVYTSLTRAGVSQADAVASIKMANENGFLSDLAELTGGGKLENPEELRSFLNKIVRELNQAKPDYGLLRQLQVAADLAGKGHEVALENGQGDVVDRTAKKVYQVKVVTGKTPDSGGLDPVRGHIKSAADQLGGSGGEKVPVDENGNPYTRVASIYIEGSDNQMTDMTKTQLARALRANEVTSDLLANVDELEIHNSRGDYVFTDFSQFVPKKKPTGF